MTTISAIVLSIILHAQTVMPILGSTQGGTSAAVPTFTPWILRAGTPVVLRPGVPLVLFK
jgi:hypothetical protein